MTDIVAVDIGGTHARFAIATLEAGRVVSLGEPVTLKTAEHDSLRSAWQHFACDGGQPLPRAAGIAIASPVGGDAIKLTNNPWIIRPALIPDELGVDRHVLVNDFGAVGHAVARLGPAYFRALCGPDTPFPDHGVITVIGPGTGLGVAQIVRRGGHAHVIETEGGHIDFAPLDALEDAILMRMRSRFHRVSVERLVSGPGLANIYAALAAIEGRAVENRDDEVLWTIAMAGEDSLAAAALDRLCLIFGAVAGDMALAQGASGVVIAGGVGLRIAEHLQRSGFAGRFAAKGRFETWMAAIPVKLIVHPQPGLYGAAAAFAAAHRA